MEPLTSPTRPGRLAFTVLIPVHAGDDADHFREAMTSIALSTLRPAEVLICQDGDLTPALAMVVESCRNAGARLTSNPGPKGLQHNLNHALRAVETPYVARADADDINLPARFALQAGFLDDHPEIAVVGAATLEFWPDGRTREKRMPRTHQEIVRWAAWRNPINHMTAFFRLEAIRECGGYPDLALKEDYGLWLMMIAEGHRLANLSEPLVRARLGEDFHRRRAGSRNLGSELSLFRLKREVKAIGLARAALATALRAAALAAPLPARLIYERVLRR